MSPSPLHSGEKAARAARRALGLDANQPIRDLLDVAEETFDVPVLIERFQDEKIAGVLLRRGEGDAFIALNADHRAVRQRFTLAHEVGHWVCQVQAGRGTPVMCRAEDLLPAADRALEREANVFADELLMPEPAVRAVAGERHPAARFGVSGEAMRWRLYGFGLGERPLEAPPSSPT